MSTSHFTCARCERHRDGRFAAPSPRGVVCEGGCPPRQCRCYCCDEHCDGRCPRPGDKGYNPLLHPQPPGYDKYAARTRSTL